MLAKAEIRAFRRFDTFELSHVDVVLAREPCGGGGRSAVSCERGSNGRTGEQLLEIGLPFGDLRNAGGEPPRRAVALDGCIRRQPVRTQRGREAVADLPRQSRQPRGWQLFGSNF